MSKIHTREQLIDKLFKILTKYWMCEMDYITIDECANEICDLIADLNDRCFHEISRDHIDRDI